MKRPLLLPPSPQAPPAPLGIVRVLRAIARDRRGATLTENIMAIGLIAVVALFGFKTFGARLQGTSSGQASTVLCLGGGTTGCSGSGGGGGGGSGGGGGGGGSGGGGGGGSGGGGGGGSGGGSCVGGVCTGLNCFVAGTPVATPSGLVPIEQIQAGDEVLTFREETGEPLVRHVSATFVTPDREVLDVHLRTAGAEGAPIRATTGHPFYTLDRGWVLAAELQPGEPLVDATGAVIAVDALTAVASHDTVYNFEVEDTHTYFVGAARVWVHNQPTGNCNGGPAPYIPVNDNAGNTTDNCYYCSAAALVGQTNSQLVNNTGIPVPPGTAQPDQIAGFLQQLGVGNGNFETFTDPNKAEAALLGEAKILPSGTAIPLGYSRPDGTGHVVVGIVKPDHTLAFVDFQTNPPTVAEGIDPASVSGGVTVFPTTNPVDVNQNPAFQQLGTYSQTAPGNVLH